MAAKRRNAAHMDKDNRVCGFKGLFTWVKLLANAPPIRQTNIYNHSLCHLIHSLNRPFCNHNPAGRSMTDAGAS